MKKPNELTEAALRENELLAENAKLRRALKPFAAFADESRHVRFRDVIPGARVTIKDAERAAKVLAARK